MLCKICNSSSKYFDEVDLNKNCCEISGYHIPNSDIPVIYKQCTKCHFIYTNHFDRHSLQDFKSIIYNDDYKYVDPPYLLERPKANAKLLSSIIDECYPISKPENIIDYGSGNGKLSEIMANSHNVTNYDPMNELYNKLPDEKFDIIFCSEVLEHVPFPKTTISDWEILLNDTGVVIFSTMIQPRNIQKVKASWWYISPRNGHISIFSKEAVSELISSHNLHYMNLSDEWHLAYKGDIEHIKIRSLQDIVDKLPTGFIPM